MVHRGLTRRELCASALAVAAAPSVSAAAPERTIDDFFNAFSDEWVRYDPDLATLARYFSGDEQDRLERQSTPTWSRDWQLGRIRLAKKGLAELRRFDRARLNGIQHVSADLMESRLDILLREEPFLDYEFPIQQMNGANVDLVESLTVDHPLQAERDAENYNAVLGQISMRMGEAIALSQRQGAKNVIPPKFILEATIRQMQSFADSSPAQNPLLTTLAQKTTAIKDLPEASRSALLADAEKAVSTQVYPAWKRAIAQLQSQLPRSSDNSGLWSLKGGLEAYSYFLERFTTTKLTPEEIHQIGLKQVAAIETEMDSLFRQLGRTSGSVKERIEKLHADLQYPNPTSEASREQIMRDIESILRDAEKRAAVLFDLRPKAPVVAQAFPAFRENNAAPSYNPPSPDGSRPGTFQYPRRLSYMTKFGLRSVVYHETVPGHHFQIAYEMENQALPRFRQVLAFGAISALNEGWGLYAQHLAAESGWYEGDIEGRLGELNSQLFRARRLVVDTGIHAKRWTRQQGIDYGIEPSEVERYAVRPGQACSYMIGEMKIIELREKARKALGDRFSVREFHNQVLQTGTVPLNVLERQIDAWIASKQRA
ncbi:MAG TPA: DUF885 domain-containing protein [Bryobacteraceae bacterium]